MIAVIPPDHDAAGNIVYDGTYIYQYDAWSRLVQVNLAAQPPPGGGPAIGDAVPGTQQLAGPLVKHFTYDGLGRLVRVLSPYPEPGATPPVGWTTAPVRSERLYYDGVRRIQEVYTDPLLALGESAAQGSGSAQGEIGQGAEEEGQTLEGEEGQIGEGEGEPGGEEPPGPPPNTFITYLEREYLWGPGDGITGGAGAGLDELIGIFDIDRRAWWTLLDASGDVVAIVDDGAATTHGFGTGSGGGGGSSSPARLCAQFTYDPYGVLLAVQELHPFPDPRTGHKGLHLDRLDAGVADPVSGAPIARHQVGATHAYFVRNRHYSPDLGRFMQRDPNATGAWTVSETQVWYGATDRAGTSPSLTNHIRDGVSVFGALGANPFAVSDSLGLFGEFTVIGQMVLTGIDAAESAEATLDTALFGVVSFLSLGAAIDQYSFDQEVDSDWAERWDMPDSDYSKAGRQAWEITDQLLVKGQEQTESGPAMAADAIGGFAQDGNLRGVSRRIYEARRAQGERLRPQFWQREARRNPSLYSSQNLSRMRQGMAPIGRDGRPMVMHHNRPLMYGGRNNWGNLSPLEASEHERRSRELHAYRDPKHWGPPDDEYNRRRSTPRRLPGRRR